jgi:hypothetical protein
MSKDNSKSRPKFQEIEIQPSGNKGWYGGAWCLAWVYSSEGNFLLKGFRGDCQSYIKDRGLKCWVVFNLYHGKVRESIAYWRRPPATPGYRTMIDTFNCDFKVYPPGALNGHNKRLKPKDYRYYICPKDSDKKSIFIKRLPSQFTNFKFENKPKNNVTPLPSNSLGNHPEFGKIRKKFDWE